MKIKMVFNKYVAHASSLGDRIHKCNKISHGTGNFPDFWTGEGRLHHPLI
jgi:hypothetical protein